MSTGIVILAAGRGSRLTEWSLPKPLIPFMGQPMIQHIIDKLPLPYFVIISPKDLSLFKQYIGDHPYLFQENPLGTGHALISQQAHLSTFDQLLVLNADTPNIPGSLIQTLLTHPSKNILVGFETEQTKGYGQIEIENDKAIKITEQKDRTTHLSNTCYSGMMKLSKTYYQHLVTIQPSTTTGEYYITDIVSKERPFELVISSQKTLQGVNTFSELTLNEALYKELQHQYLLEHSVSSDDPSSIILHRSHLKPHTHIEKNVTLKDSSIGSHCYIGQGSILHNVIIKDHVTIHPYSVLSNCCIDQHSQIGPFAHIQNNTKIGQNVTIGNFVEIKRSIIKNGVKAKHLSYLGDAYIDEKANIGAGSITCNYVPWKKEKSMSYIGPYALIGANTLMIAPCYIGPYTVSAAGTILSGLIPPKKLAISRSKLIVKNFVKNQGY